MGGGLFVPEGLWGLGMGLRRQEQEERKCRNGEIFVSVWSGSGHTLEYIESDLAGKGGLSDFQDLLPMQIEQDTAQESRINCIPGDGDLTSTFYVN